MQLMRFRIEPPHVGVPGDGGRHSRHNPYCLCLLVRQYFAKPPHVAADRQDCAKNTDGCGGEQAREDQGDAESQDDRPRRRRR